MEDANCSLSVVWDDDDPLHLIEGLDLVEELPNEDDPPPPTDGDGDGGGGCPSGGGPLSAIDDDEDDPPKPNGVEVPIRSASVRTTLVRVPN